MLLMPCAARYDSGSEVVGVKMRMVGGWMLELEEQRLWVRKTAILTKAV